MRRIDVKLQCCDAQINTIKEKKTISKIVRNKILS